MTLEKLCLRISSFKPDITRKEIYSIIFRYFLMMIGLGVLVGLAITKVTNIIAILGMGIFTVFFITVVGLTAITESEESFDAFLNWFKLWWLYLIIEIALNVVVALFL